MMQQLPVPIAGDLVTTAESVEIRNPWRGELVAEVPLCGPAEVDAACRGAAAALAAGAFPQRRRAEVLERAAALLRERADDFARTITRESGKPIRTARGEVARCLDTLIFSAGEARRLSGELVAAEASAAGAGALAFALRVPIGVIAAITPFNFPLNLVAHKIAPAIAAGCPVVLKPAPATPLSAIALVELLREAGMPAAWISVVTDRVAEAGPALVEHPVPRLVTFTGSAAVGWRIAASAPKKKVALELGSTAPLIVEPDADLADVAARVRVAGYAGAGQSCISVQRLLVHAEAHERLVAELGREVAAIRCGDPADEATEVGPLIRAAETERLTAWIDEARGGGARVVCGGKGEGAMFEPTLVDRVPTDCRLWQSEVFGPVVAVRSYRDFDEAIELANQGSLKLQAGVFTADLDKALAAVRRLDFGGVLINDVPTSRLDQQPYGGIEDGGNTREGPAYAVAEMTELRFVSLRPSPGKRG
jgi:acyl-CoA reductase-like NAD-dependent aldehyde dehydrogenase